MSKDMKSLLAVTAAIGLLTTYVAIGIVLLLVARDALAQQNCPVGWNDRVSFVLDLDGTTSKGHLWVSNNTVGAANFGPYSTLSYVQWWSSCETPEACRALMRPPLSAQDCSEVKTNCAPIVGVLATEGNTCALTDSSFLCVDFDNTGDCDDIPLLLDGDRDPDTGHAIGWGTRDGKVGSWSMLPTPTF